MPTLRQLDYLVALADTLHFRRAAERVNTTQSTLSLQVKALEERLGVSLVERTHTKVMLTPIGTEITAVARRMLRDAQSIRDISKQHGNTLAGVMRLGVPPSIGPSLLPRVIPKIRQRFPLLKLFVREEPPQHLPRALEAGEYDLIVTVLPVVAKDLASSTVFCEPLYLAMAKDHPLAHCGSINTADLRDVEVLALGPGNPLHHMVLVLCEKSGARLLYDYEGTSLETLSEMVAMGLGVTFLPGLFVRTRLVNDASIVVREISDHPLSRTVGLMWRQSSASTHAFSQLADVMRQEILSEMPDFAAGTTK